MKHREYLAGLGRAGRGARFKKGMKPYLSKYDISNFKINKKGFVLADSFQIDDTIQSALTDWNLRRLHIADLSILRAGSYEMLYLEDIPPIVSINEAIELAKKFGSEDSSRFVNGILDQIKKNCFFIWVNSKIFARPSLI